MENLIFVATFDVSQRPPESNGARRQHLEKKSRDSSARSSSGVSGSSHSTAATKSTASLRTLSSNKGAISKGKNKSRSEKTSFRGIFKARRREVEDSEARLLSREPSNEHPHVSASITPKSLPAHSLHEEQTAEWHDRNSDLQSAENLPESLLPETHTLSKDLPPLPLLASSRKSVSPIPQTQPPAEQDSEAQHEPQRNSSLSMTNSYHDILSEFAGIYVDESSAPPPLATVLATDRSDENIAKLPAKAYQPSHKPGPVVAENLCNEKSVSVNAELCRRDRRLRPLNNKCSTTPGLPETHNAEAYHSETPKEGSPRARSISPSRFPMPKTVPSAGPFARMLDKMNHAGLKIISTRLAENWISIDGDNSSDKEVDFEKRLWALTAYQRLTQGKQLQSPIHDVLISGGRASRRRILHLYGSLADGWTLAARYPSSTVYTLSSENPDDVPSTYPPPLNHHSFYVPSESMQCPFPDSYFDVVFSRSVSVHVRVQEWRDILRDWVRVLKPQGHFEILSLDPTMNRAGRMLTNWVDNHIHTRLEEDGISTCPSNTILSAMEAADLHSIRRARIALPTSLPRSRANAANSGAIPESKDSQDINRLMVFLGRHLYQDLYSRFLQFDKGETYFWSEKEIRRECERMQTKMILTILCGEKANIQRSLEAHLDG